MSTLKNKKKIINDPVHGFIHVTHNTLHDIIEHPFFQRLRRIKQLGLTHLVYPGAMHSRFHHAIGAMFLMDEALRSLRQKKHEISGKEFKAAKAAILLHDIGHGPFSHALEHSIVNQISHEEISLIFMERLNKQMEGKLETATRLFNNEYPKHFISQLISSQLDVDRMDYLRRDSFYTGVSEGIIGTQRIIKMLDVDNDGLVVEEKGIYSIDNFLNSRRIMYWQVYLHKTVLSAEFTLINILKRANYLAQEGKELFASPALNFFLRNRISKDDFHSHPEVLEHFAQLDDFDIMSAIKVWSRHEDPVLSDLCERVIHRKLLKIKLSDKAFEEEELQEKITALHQQMPFSKDHESYYVFAGLTENQSYSFSRNSILIKMKNQSVVNLSEVSDQWTENPGNFLTRKYFICYPQEIISQ
jgi:HD superfamily phosphohydrolase